MDDSIQEFASMLEYVMGATEAAMYLGPPGLHGTAAA